MEPSRGTAEKSKQYAALVNRHSNRTKETSLYCGSNYLQLARFLNKPAIPNLEANSRKDAAGDTFAFVTLHTFPPGRDKETAYFGASSRRDLSGLRISDRENGQCQLLFMCGYPSPDWLNTLGRQYRIDPEFFRRHLSFNQHGDNNNMFDLPALPGSSRNILQLRLTTICTRTVPLSKWSVPQYRRDEVGLIRRHQQQLTVGRSIVRRYSHLDNTKFTIEQVVSCCVKRKKDGSWTTIIWLDSGKNLAEDASFPWLGDDSHLSARQNHCLPIFHHQPKAAFRLGESDNGSNNAPVAPSSSITRPISGADSSNNIGRNLAQNITHLPDQYDHFLDPNILRVDAFYAISDLLRLSANSESQFLNLIHQQVKTELSRFESQMELSIFNLRYCKALVDDHTENIRDALSFLSTGGDRNWPRATEPAHIDIVRAVRDTLQADFQRLLARAQELSRHCVEGSDTIVGVASLQESRKAISKAEALERLTILAFFFLPLSFTTSFFGMNFKELGTGGLSIWVAFVTLGFMMGIATLLCFWDNVKAWWVRRSEMPLSEESG